MFTHASDSYLTGDESAQALTAAPRETTCTVRHYCDRAMHKKETELSTKQNRKRSYHIKGRRSSLQREYKLRGG